MDFQLISFEVISSKAVFFNHKGETQLQLRYACTPNSKAIKNFNGEMLTRKFLDENHLFQIEVNVSCWTNHSKQAGLLRSTENGVCVSLNADMNQFSSLMNMRANSKHPKSIDITIANAFNSISEANQSSSLYYEMKQQEYDLDSWTLVV